MTAEPNETWTLRNATAWVFTAHTRLTRPVLLVGDAGVELADLAARAEHDAYPLLSELKARGHDLILLGLPADGSMTGDGGTVQNTVVRALAELTGDVPLVVGGTGQGALAARYALAGMEYQRMDHRTGVFFSHNAAAPELEDEAELSRMGERPTRPLFLRCADEGVDDGLGDGIADETLTGGATVGPLLSKEYGSWLLDRLP
ncbi:hypothetical protein [Streptomyces sp. TLI_105]|uniref:hypothetical protein n=1 Tax=Streptomyces sp. TLI_105 TaxID=1881019 RepID=UPI000897CAEE|nr:hypothetical protein [Streptomyces sp. TLI_105]SED23315.1 hypothetical protein SAMN05428939_4603 [Streptomyces sp. TLI_105]